MTEDLGPERRGRPAPALRPAGAGPRAAAPASARRPVTDVRRVPPRQAAARSPLGGPLVALAGLPPARRTGRDAAELLTEAWGRTPADRVELACGGGRGRTGTALACLAVLDGVPPEEAVDFVRRHYDRHAVETPWQRRYVQHFAG